MIDSMTTNGCGRTNTTRYQRVGFSELNQLIARLLVAGERLEPPTLVLFFSDQPPDDR